MEMDLAQIVALVRRLQQELGMAGRTNVIAECKRRSPSKGVLAADYDPVRIAKAYERG